MTNSTHPGKARFIGLNLNSGVTPKNLLTFYLACLTGIMLATFIPSTQPFLLSEVLKVPEAERGVISGNLNFWGEIVIILSVGFWGSLSDKIGRKAVTVMGYTVMAAGLILYGLSQDTTDLLIARLVYSFGIASVSTMIIALMADYASDENRGKATGYLGMMNGVGAMIAVLFLLKLPNMYQGQGLDAGAAAFATYSTMAVVAVIVALAMFLGLKPGQATHNEEKVSLIQQTRDGFAAAKDSGVMLAYGSSFVARGNLTVVGTFFTLWGSIYGTNELGMTAAEALAKSGGIVAISYIASLFSAPIFGIMSDRMKRVDALAITLLIGAIGYTGTYFIDNPFSLGMIGLLILIGMAEVGCIITSGVLIAQQAEEKIRGSVVGIFTFSGAMGILIASVVGGQLFDNWLKSGPFVFFGFIAACVFIWALIVRNKIKPVAEANHAAITTIETAADVV